MISEETARKAVERWHMPGRVRPAPCGCRDWAWIDTESGLLRWRRVYVCPDHRQAWEDSHFGFVYRAYS